MRKPTIKELTQAYEEILQARDAQPSGSAEYYRLAGLLWAIVIEWTSRRPPK